MRRRRQLARALSLATVLAFVAACSPGLAANPRYATDSGAGPQGAPQTTKPPTGPPPIEAPKNDLSWRDCTSRGFSDAAVQPLPGVTLDCASYDADLDPINGATGTVSIGVVRAKGPQTPQDAGPLVMTTGSDLPSSMQLPVWLSRAGADVLKSHPIVAVDRRGTGMSGALDCRDLFDRHEMLDQAQVPFRHDPVANLRDITPTAPTSRTETISACDAVTRDRRTGRDGYLVRAVRGRQLSADARPEGRVRLAAGCRVGRQLTWRRLGIHGRRRDHHRVGLPSKRPRQLPQRPRGGR